MPVKLNLLPTELRVSKNFGSLLKTLKALGVIGVAAFFVFGIGVGIFFIISTISLNGINANLVKLKSQVSALQKSEQTVILLKDRIAKIVSIQKQPNSIQNLTVIEPFLANILGTGSINQMTIDVGGVDLSVNLKTNADASVFLEAFQSSEVFKSINLGSYNLNPSTGYSIEINAVRK